MVCVGQRAGAAGNVQELYEHLVTEYGYEGSYPSVVRFVRARYPRPKIWTYRRVETPPGAQSQTDWGEYPGVDIAGELSALHAFVMVLSHSRKPAMAWRRREDELSWLRCHNESFRRLAGVAAAIEIVVKAKPRNRDARRIQVIDDVHL
jgi:transposase